MSKRMSNYIFTIFTFLLAIIAVGELFFDFTWISIIGMIVCGLVFYVLIGLICLNISKIDKRIEYMIYVIFISILILTTNYWILIPGIIIIVFSLKYLSSLSKTILTIAVIMLIAISMLLSLTSSELIDKKMVSEDISPDGVHCIQQEYIDASLGGRGVKVSMHRDIMGIIDMSYTIVNNRLDSEIEWIDNTTFMVGGELIKVKF